MTLFAGQSFRSLKIQALLGEGGMGAAYLASHPLLKTSFLVKTFKAAPGADLFAEAHLAARVVLPHVVPVLDAGHEGGLPFIVQRYVDGIDLDELLRLLGRLPAPVVAHIAVDVARGLQAIHQAGVVHRDIKPANVFLAGDGTALIGDFGIALDAAKPAVVGRIAGTPPFMAPELWRQEAITPATDIYALGVTLHLLAMGQVYFDGPTWQAIAVQHQERHYTPPASDDPRERTLFSAIEWMLRKDPLERPRSCDELAAQLQPLLNGALPSLRHLDRNRATLGALELTLYQGDLASGRADVLVNAANVGLQMDMGVARALRLAGGDEIEVEAIRQAPARMGDVVWSGAGRLQASAVAHAVAALDGAICIQRCTLRTLVGAESRRARSIMFPALGSGVGDVPMALVAKLMLEAIRTFASFGPKSVREVGIVLYDGDATARWQDVLARMS
jgi:serine/threonine-protein kinase